MIIAGTPTPTPTPIAILSDSARPPPPLPVLPVLPGPEPVLVTEVTMVADEVEFPLVNTLVIVVGTTLGVAVVCVVTDEEPAVAATLADATATSTELTILATL
jgi:hypothetical protein